MALLSPLDGKKEIRLKDIDPGFHASLTEEEAVARSQELLAEMRELQNLLYAAQQTSVLIVLQGMDSAGKDGAIGHVMTGLNPQSCKVASFKQPTPLEAGHDFLWRVHPHVPAKGTVTIFNRSHYEDVLVVRVHDLAPKQAWKKRYEQINHFESLLADSSTVIIKFFLHISKDEQKERLLAREQDPAKAWKLSAGDWHERDLWDNYQKAYQDAINLCAARHAPWYVVPANHKWFRNLAMAETIVRTLRPFRKQWMKHLEAIGEKARAELAEMRSTQGSTHQP